MKNYRIIKKKDAKSVNLGTKMITKYISMNKDLEVNHMKISGRHPVNKNHFLYETVCHLMLFILSGSGHFFCEHDEFILRKGDVLEILPKTKFAISARHVSYLSFQQPAWSKEQSFIVDKEGNVIEDTER